MQYQAIAYDGVIIKRIIEAGSIDMLKKKCAALMKNDNITSIVVSEIKDIGYLKVPKAFGDIFKNNMI